MARAPKPKKNPPPKENAVAVPPPSVDPEVLSGLEAIRIHGGRDEELYISAEGQFFEEAFMTDRIITAEENVRFIKKIEALIRSSREYKAFISYVRNDLGMNKCSFLSGIDYTQDGMSLEIHHCPLTLFDIVEIVINHRLSRNQPVTSMTVADEVMRMHLEGKIGVTPLSRSVHKLVHAGAITVHPAQVHGNWIEFLRDYSDGVSEDLVAKLLAFVSQTEEGVIRSCAKLDTKGLKPVFREGAYIPTMGEIEVLFLV